RFALARCLVDLGPNEKRSVLLRRRKAADGDAPQTGPSIETELTNGSWCSVTTGPARFDLHPSRFTLFHNVFLDLDLDGEFEPDAGERIMTANDAAGPLLVDRFDGIYAGATDPDVSMWIEESGPLMLVVIVEGKHAPVGKGHIGRDFLKYRTRLTFVAGSSAV